MRRWEHTADSAVLVALCLGLVVVSCSGAGTQDAAQPSRHPTEDRHAVIEAHQALVEAYQKGDADALVLLLDKTDELLIYHPRLQDRWVGIDEVQHNLSQMFERLGGSKWLDVHLDVSLEGDVAWLTSHVVIESPSVEQPFTGRGTEVWVRRDAGWRLAHGHWSANPEFEGAAL